MIVVFGYSRDVDCDSTLVSLFPRSTEGYFSRCGLDAALHFVD